VTTHGEVKSTETMTIQISKTQLKVNVDFCARVTILSKFKTLSAACLWQDFSGGLASTG
jgi:hypothetical protein